MQCKRVTEGNPQACLHKDHRIKFVKQYDMMRKGMNAAKLADAYCSFDAHQVSNQLLILALIFWDHEQGFIWQVCRQLLSLVLLYNLHQFTLHALQVQSLLQAS